MRKSIPKKQAPSRFLYGLDDIPTISRCLVNLLETCHVMTFSGPLGAGKTTLIRTILRTVGVKVPIPSPTFTYVNIYTHSDTRFYHFDLYRVTNLSVFCGLGFDEYLYAHASRSFIEWPEVITPLLKTDVCHVLLEYEGDVRAITITREDGRCVNLLCPRV